MGYLREAPEQMNIEEQIEWLNKHWLDWGMPEYREAADTMEKLNAVYLAAKAFDEYDDYFVHPPAEITAWKRIEQAIAEIDNGK